MWCGCGWLWTVVGVVMWHGKGEQLMSRITREINDISLGLKRREHGLERDVQYQRHMTYDTVSVVWVMTTILWHNLMLFCILLTTWWNRQCKCGHIQEFPEVISHICVYMQAPGLIIDNVVHASQWDFTGNVWCDCDFVLLYTACLKQDLAEFWSMMFE